MLGKLVRWLRMLGQDTLYSTEFDDSGLLEIAKKETRVLLTKDLELYKRAVARGLDSFYIQGKTETDRLVELAQRYALPLTVDMEKSHCPLCNTKLEVAPKGQLTMELEKNTLTYYDRFWKCPHCGQVYWQGAHWKQITDTLNEAKERLDILKIDA